MKKLEVKCCDTKKRNDRVRGREREREKEREKERERWWMKEKETQEGG
jgi:hypothetical protein